MKNLLSFDKFYIPKIINVIFWISLIVYILVGLVILFSSHYNSDKVIGLLYIIFGPFITRIVCEVMLIPFKIYEKVSSIEEKMLNKYLESK